MDDGSFPGRTHSGYKMIISFEALSLIMGDFDPKKHTAEEAGYDAKDNYVRGLKMPEKRFKNMVHNHSADEQKSMRKQVDDAEAAGLRSYQVKHSKGYYTIENGIVIGSAKG